MLRAEVLRKWKDFKKQYLGDRNLLAELSSHLSFMASARTTPDQVLADLKDRLPAIVQRGQDLRSKFTNSQFGDTGGELFFTYTTYFELITTYQKIIEYYNEGGPTIEEV